MAIHRRDIGLATIVLIGTAIVFVSGLQGWLGGPPARESLTAENSTPAVDTVTPNTNNAAEPPAVETRVESTGSGPAAPASSAPLAPPPQPMTPGIAPLASARKTSTTSSQPDRYDVPSAPIDTATQQPATTDVAATPPPADATANLPSTQPAASPPPLPPPSAPPTVSVTSTPPGALPTESPATPPATSIASSTPIPAASAPATAPVDLAASDVRVPPDAATPPAPLDSGTYMGGKTVLIRYNDKAGAGFAWSPARR